MSIVTPCTWRARASRWTKWPERVRQSGKLNRCLQLALSWLLGHFVFNMFQTAHSSQSMGQIKAAASEAGIDWCSTALSDDESRPSLSLSLPGNLEGWALGYEFVTCPDHILVCWVKSLNIFLSSWLNVRYCCHATLRLICELWKVVSQGFSWSAGPRLSKYLS